MERRSNKQISLRPLDLLVVLKIVCAGGRPLNYGQLGAELLIAPSQAHSSVRRANSAHLLIGSSLNRAAVREFVLYGAKYSFPAVLGFPTRGIPTAYAAPPLNSEIAQPDDLPPVWPHPDGKVRGVAVAPLHPTVPAVVDNDQRLYEMLALFDALRMGAAREREAAAEFLSARL